MNPLWIRPEIVLFMHYIRHVKPSAAIAILPKLVKKWVWLASIDTNLGCHNKELVILSYQAW